MMMIPQLQQQPHPTLFSINRTDRPPMKNEDLLITLIECTHKFSQSVPCWFRNWLHLLQEMYVCDPVTKSLFIHVKKHHKYQKNTLLITVALPLPAICQEKMWLSTSS